MNNEIRAYELENQEVEIIEDEYDDDVVAIENLPEIKKALRKIRQKENDANSITKINMSSAEGNIYDMYINKNTTQALNYDAIKQQTKNIESVEKLCFPILYDIFSNKIEKVNILNFAANIFEGSEIRDIGIGIIVIVELNKSYTKNDIDKLKKIYEEISTLLFIPKMYNDFGFSYADNVAICNGKHTVKKITQSTKTYSMTDLQNTIRTLKNEPFKTYYAAFFGKTKNDKAKCIFCSSPAEKTGKLTLTLFDFDATCFGLCSETAKMHNLLFLFGFFINEFVFMEILTNLKKIYGVILSDQTNITFDINNETISDLFKKINDVFKTQEIYNYNNSALSIATSQTGEKEAKIIDDTTKARGFFQNAFNYIEIRKQGKEKIAESKVFSYEKILTYMASDEIKNNFKPVDTIAPEPVYSNQFILLKQGYNADNHTYVLGDNNKISYENKHIKTLLSEFCFRENSSKENYLGHLVDTQLSNHFIPGRPLIDVDGNQSSVGKTLLADTSYYLAERQDAEHVTYCEDAEEFDKRIGANLMKGHRVVVIDNAKADGRIREIRSQFLENLITAPRINTRVLGKSLEYSKCNNCIFILTMNNTRLCADLISRALPVNLYYEGASRKRKFHIIDLMQYVKENAVEIIAELRGMVEKWKEQGMPLRTNLNFRFRAWAQTIGGILYANGYVDFLKNIDSSEQEMNTEVHDLKDLAADAKNKYMSAQDWAILAESKYVFSELKNKSLRAKSQFISAVFKRYSNDSMCDDNNYFQIKQQLNQKKNGIEWAFIDIAKTEKTEPSEIAIDEITEISETPAEKKVVSGIVSELQPPDNKESSETSETSETFSDHVVSQTNFNNNIFCSQGGIRDIVSEVSENHIVSENLGKGGNDLDFE